MFLCFHCCQSTCLTGLIKLHPYGKKKIKNALKCQQTIQNLSTNSKINEALRPHDVLWTNTNSDSTLEDHEQKSFYLFFFCRTKKHTKHMWHHETASPAKSQDCHVLHTELDTISLSHNHNLPLQWHARRVRERDVEHNWQARRGLVTTTNQCHQGATGTKKARPAGVCLSSPHGSVRWANSEKHYTFTTLSTISRIPIPESHEVTFDAGT